MASLEDEEVLLEKARIDLARDHLADAQEKCLLVLSAYEHHPGALAVLGRVLFAQGQHEQAVRVFNALALMQPAIADHWQNLGTALRPTGRLDQAVEAFDRALRLAQPSAALLYNLGVLQMERGDYNAAYLALHDATKLAPMDATIRWGFAQCCSDLLNIEEAIEALEGWEHFEGLTDELTVRICFILVMLGEQNKAMEAIERLLTDPPRDENAAFGLACILERLHRLEAARTIMKQRVPTSNDPEKLKLAALLAERAGNLETSRQLLLVALENHQRLELRHHLLFPLAKVQDAMGHSEEAFATATQAHMSQIKFCESVMGKSILESSILSRIEFNCDVGDIATWKESVGPSMECSPIFIVGFPRSGTTLLEQILDAHPGLQSMDEQPFLVALIDDIRKRGLRYPAELGKLTKGDLSSIRGVYWESVGRKVSLQPSQRLVDKNPLNLTALPLIRLLFPNAKIILCVRHPCDVLLSCFLQNFRAPELALLCRDLATLTNAYSRIFEFWYSQKALLRPSVFELKYEDLVAHFPARVHEIADFLQVPWEQAMMTPAKHALAKGFISTPSYAQVLEPVNSNSISRWRHYKRHFRHHIPLLMQWIQHWDYEAE